ncbi:putative polysaccharide biosynthesis protein [Pseudalkalibacillus berkeleyi]|uniref:Polysaccharide biosynthesis protein n=1 Tax=Pseudalkalibacillus berkeleyi TaxID=1069813 RepID=A0ABS9H6P8_9BACL|nr:polysaccharide biosynthesis protein [Pseudalkalibacillus berkeleyi]MCF6139596.1 polysaccharide biosynthesis protein [Pseudalkalibacillus berkeleyi]
MNKVYVFFIDLGGVTMLDQTDVQKTFWRGTLVISGAALIVKVLSAFYRIPFQNIAGDLGLYVYQQVYPFYAIAFALSLYGFPLIISKIISENEGRQARDALTTTFVGLCTFFVIVFLILYHSADHIAKGMNDPMLVGPLRMASFSFLFVPFLSVMRGYYQGEKDMTPTAVSQIAEQMIRVGLILIFTIYLVTNGADRYLVGSGAVFGGLAGSVVAIFILGLFLKKQSKPILGIHFLPIRQSTALIGTILKGGLAICITAVMFALFQLVDALQVVPGLQSSGMDSLDAKVSKGVFDRGQPLLQLGTVLATAMALPLIPFIAKANQSNDRKRVIEFAGQSLKFSFIVGGAAAIGLAVIIEPTNVFLYEDQNGSLALGILGVAILFGSIAITSSAILQGLGKISFPVLFILISLGIKGLLNLWFIPHFGITGAAITTVMSAAFVAICNLMMVQKLTNVFQVHRFSSLKVVFALILMAVSTFLWKESLLLFQSGNERLVAGVIALSSAGIGAAVYLLVLMYQNVWNRDELRMLPKGEYLIKWFYRDRRGENG